MDTVNQIWDQVLAYVQPKLSQIAFDIYIKCMEPRNIEDGEMVVTVRTEFLRDNIVKMYSELLLEALRETLGIPVGLRVVSLESAADPGATAAIPIQGNGFPTTLADEDYTFDNFVVGSSNNLAHAAALNVANNIGIKINPLFIYGSSGLGKTHLMYAIANRALQRNPSLNIICIKGEEFTNQLVEAISHGRTVQFRAKYRKVDMLLIDDIQFIAGKDATQTEFFHTFDALYEDHRQIILTSDRPPRELVSLEARIRSRFEQGLLVDIKPPDYELRLAILRNKVSQNRVDVPGDVVDFLAKNLQENIRQLEGVVKKLVASNLLTGQPVNMEMVLQTVPEYLQDAEPVSDIIQRIIAVTAKHCKVTEEDILGTSRKKNIQNARNIAMYVTRAITNSSLPQIGAAFDRDHSTVLHSIRKIEVALKSDNQQLSDNIRDITANINSCL